MLSEIPLVILAVVAAPFVIVSEMKANAKTPGQKIYLTVFTVLLFAPILACSWMYVASIQNWFIDKQAESKNFTSLVVVNDLITKKEKYVDGAEAIRGFRAGDYLPFSDIKYDVYHYKYSFISTQEFKNIEAVREFLESDWIFASAWNKEFDFKKHHKWSGGGRFWDCVLVTFFAFLPLLLLVMSKLWFSWIFKKEEKVSEQESFQDAA